MTAAERLATIGSLPANELCSNADRALTTLVELMNEETTLLRAGHLKQAGQLSARKTQLAQDYVVLARTIQREGPRLKREAPTELATLQSHHESFATQMAENLRVLATAKSVSENLLKDVATAVGSKPSPKTYGANGTMPEKASPIGNGLTLNRAL